jgi:hypothetical protein
VKTLAGLSLFGLFLLASLWSVAAVADHLAADRETARRVKLLKNACGKPRKLRVDWGTT